MCKQLSEPSFVGHQIWQLRKTKSRFTSCLKFNRKSQRIRQLNVVVLLCFWSWWTHSSFWISWHRNALRWNSRETRRTTANDGLIVERWKIPALTEWLHVLNKVLPVVSEKFTFENFLVIFQNAIHFQKLFLWDLKTNRAASYNRQ